MAAMASGTWVRFGVAMTARSSRRGSDQSASAEGTMAAPG